MTTTPGPSLRWSLVAFAVMTGVIIAAATGLLVLLDPRSQVWWRDVFSSLGSFVRSFVP